MPSYILTDVASDSAVVKSSAVSAWDSGATSAQSIAALRASEVNVRTTPLTCGCQASVAIKIRIFGPRTLLLILNFETFGPRYFRRMTLLMRNHFFTNGRQALSGCASFRTVYQIFQG